MGPSTRVIRPHSLMPHVPRHTPHPTHPKPHAPQTSGLDLTTLTTVQFRAAGVPTRQKQLKRLSIDPQARHVPCELTPFDPFPVFTTRGHCAPCQPPRAPVVGKTVRNMDAAVRSAGPPPRIAAGKLDHPRAGVAY